MYLERLLLREQHALMCVLAHVVVHVERRHLQLAAARHQLHASAAFLRAHLQAATNTHALPPILHQATRDTGPPNCLLKHTKHGDGQIITVSYCID